MSTAVTYIPDHYKTLFNQNFGQDVQQMLKRLAPYVTIETDEIPGNGKRYDDLASRAAMEQTSGRATATRRRDASSRSRWLFVNPYDDASVVGEFDQQLLGRVTNPASDIMRSISAARNRTCDDIILGGVRDPVSTGSAGTGSSSLPSAQKVAAIFKYDTDGYTETTHGSALPLTVHKIRKALEILGTGEALEGGMAGSMGDCPVLALRAKDKNALFADITVTSRDYSASQPYSDGVLEEFLGVKLIHTERLAVSSGEAKVLLWMPSAIYFAEDSWNAYMDVLPGESHGLQVRVAGRMGAMRRYDEKVVEISVDE